MKTYYFHNSCSSKGEIQLRYDELCKLYEGQVEMLKSIRAEYSSLMAELDHKKPAEAVKERASISETIKALQEKVNSEGLHLEICGTWLWVTGKTFPVKDTLKDLGFRFSANKLCWYYRQDEHRSSNQKPVPFELIKEKYGSKEIALT
ncbi:MAG: hypothetical protein JXB49_33975 [Bacteroidales bacterium]|nr:hypothetical protein [Bacteroidales bacterium]